MYKTTRSYPQRQEKQRDYEKFKAMSLDIMAFCLRVKAGNLPKMPFALILEN